jgi:hypothetical protein
MLLIDYLRAFGPMTQHEYRQMITNKDKFMEAKAVLTEAHDLGDTDGDF